MRGAGVWLSPATWSAKDYSDLDLAVVGEGPLPRGALARLKEAFEESRLPMRVDVVDWHAIADGFRQAIESDCVVVQSATPRAGWRAVSIGDIADVVGGGTPSTNSKPENFNGEIPWLTPKDLSGTHDRYIERLGERNVSQQGLDSSSAKLLPPGAVLLSTRAPIGYVALAKNPLSTNQGFRSLVVRDTAVPEYLYYWLKLNTEELERHASGSTFRELSGSSLKEIRLSLPPLPEQRAIAAVLDSIDEAIERTEEVIAATERLHDALLHELLTRGLPGRHSAWREVPGLGTIPACWEVMRLGDVCSEPIRNGFSPGAVEEPTGWWLLTLAAVSPNGFVPEAAKPAPIDPRVKSSRLVSGDLLVSRSNTSDRVGLAGVYRGIPKNCSYPDLLMRVRLDATLAFVEIAEAELLSGRGRSFFQRHARGTSGSMVKITGDILRGFPLVLPPVPEQRAIVAALGSVDVVIVRAREERAALQSSKASAADALLTGRVRVPTERAHA